VAEAYRPNPYHNATHAADVVQTTAALLAGAKPASAASAAEGAPAWLKDGRLQAFILLVAAAVHDAGHLGRNNNFLVETKHPLALEFNNKSAAHGGRGPPPREGL
jgi:hypothetical protein